MALHKIIRLSAEVDELGSIYSQICRDTESLKETKRQLKRQLKEAREHLETMTTQAADRKLAKADGKTAIKELEHRLSLSRAALQTLYKARDRAFSRREEAKAKMMEKMVGAMTSPRPAEIQGPEDVAAVSKMMEWLRVCPPVGRLPEGVNSETRDAYQRCIGDDRSSSSRS